MSSKLPAGFHDLLLTDRASEALDLASSRTRLLDIAESARLAEVLQRQLAGVLNDLADGESIQPQLALVNGLLTVDLVREVPETMKPRTIQIGANAPKVQNIDAKAA